MTRERSEPGLDVYRGIAVVMMFVVHARRLQSPQSYRGAGEASLEFFMRIEPFIAASFLFLAGYSLVLSVAKSGSRREWFLRMSRRSLVLYALSVLLYVLQYGVDLPDLLASSGILQAIAVAIVGVSLCLTSRDPRVPLALLLGAVLAGAAWLEWTRTSVSGLNAGPGGAVPIIGFAAFGALVALSRSVTLATQLSLAPFALALLSRLPLTNTHVSEYTDFGGEVAVVALLKGASLDGAARVPMAFWNHSVAGVAALLFPLCMGLLALTKSPHSVTGHGVLAPLRLLGRHALPVYVAHLCALGALDAVGLRPGSAMGTWALVLGLALGLALLATLRERLPKAQNSPRVAR